MERDAIAHQRGEPRTYVDPNCALARHDKTYNGDDTGWAVRFKNWKLRYYGCTDTYGLFDLNTDISEAHNLADQHPELIEQMKEHFEAWHANIKKDQQNYDLPESSEF
ncbi:hypothetical protein DMA11_13875 [Marinilabiliaceae bacterium JC017]|nr:hypothetical protein DMA11_13875 [Marinilabiliaceae bacterium JC017]